MALQRLSLCQVLVACAGLLRRKLLAQTAESRHRPSEVKSVGSHEDSFALDGDSFCVWREQKASSDNVPVEGVR
jgi:hypothetical protein